MVWIVTYRNKDGSQDQMSLEAESRNAVFAALQKRGINAIRVEQSQTGKSRLAKASSRSARLGKSPALTKGIAAGLLVCVLSVAAWFFISRNVDTSAKPGKRGPAKLSLDSPSMTKTNAKGAADGSATPTDARAAKPGNGAGGNPRAASGDEETQDADPNASEAKPRPRRVFKHGTDQLIWLAVFASNGSSIPPLPHISPEDTDRFINSLNDPIGDDPDDPPRVKEMKRKVDEIRKEIAELIAQNPDKELSDILNEHRSEFNARLDIYAEARKAYDELLAEGDAEEAEAYRKSANELLEQYGAKQLEPDGEESDEQN